MAGSVVLGREMSGICIRTTTRDEQPDDGNGTMKRASVKRAEHPSASNACRSRGRRYPRTATFGRPSTPVEVILRMLIVKHLYDWSYEQTEQWVSDSLVLRQFCRVYAERVPDDTTLLRWANLIQPATLQQFLDHVV